MSNKNKNIKLETALKKNLKKRKILKIPSVSEIMNLVRKAPDKKSNSKSSQRNHIYFYGN